MPRAAPGRARRDRGGSPGGRPDERRRVAGDLRRVRGGRPHPDAGQGARPREGRHGRQADPLPTVSSRRLALAALAGLRSRRRPAAGVTLLLLLVAAAGGAAMTRPTARLLDLLPAVATAVVGAGVLLGLRRLLQPRRPDPRGSGASRRTFLVGAAGITAGAAVGGAIGQRLAERAIDISELTLPSPATPTARCPPASRRRSRACRRSGPPPRASTGSTPTSPCRQRRLLVAQGRRRRAQPLHDDLRRAPRDADDRARHHPHLRLQRGGRRVRRRRTLARRPAGRRPRPRRGRSPTRSSVPPSTGSPSARRSPWPATDATQ